jgi:hypothetical protein
MTVKGQKNHYNVKVLRGHGVSISLKNNRVCLRGGSDVFTGEYEWFVTQIPYERLVFKQGVNDPFGGEKPTCWSLLRVQLILTRS